MNSSEDWYTALAQKPAEWESYAVFADWLEEHGLPSACARWVSVNRKRPWNSSVPACSWFDADKVEPNLGDPESDLPGHLFRALTGGTLVANHRTYESCEDAIRALFEAWESGRSDPTDVPPAAVGSLPSRERL